MVDLEYAFLMVMYEVTGFGRNDHGSYPTGVWHLGLFEGSEVTSIDQVAGDMSQHPAQRLAAAVTALAVGGWRPQETTLLAQAFHDRRYDNLMMRLARPTPGVS